MERFYLREVDIRMQAVRRPAAHPLRPAGSYVAFMTPHSPIRFLTATLTIVAAAAFPAMAQQAFPSKPIRMIVPFPPGGGVTAVARVLGPKLTEAWGQSIVIDNRPGGNTIIGKMPERLISGRRKRLYSSAKMRASQRKQHG